MAGNNGGKEVHDETFEEEAEEIYVDVPRLIRLIASPCRQQRPDFSPDWKGTQLQEGSGPTIQQL